MVKHGVYAIGNAHISGSGPRLFAPGGPSFSTLPPLNISTTGGTVQLEYDGATSVGTPFPKDRILIGSVSGAKCRVLNDFGGRVLGQIIMTSPFGQIVGFTLGETLTDNTAAMTGGSNKTAILQQTIPGIGIIKQEHQVQSTNALTAQTQFSALLLNPLLNTATPADLTRNIYWDRASKRARNISLTSIIGLFQTWDLISQSSSRATVCRISGATLELIDVNGSAWSSGGGTVTGPTSGYGKLTFNNQPNDGDTVTIASSTYTFKTTLTPTSGQVLIGGSIAATAQNFKDCINHTGTPGTQYASATPVDPTVTCYTTSITTFLDFVAKTLPSTAATSTSSGGRLTWTSGTTLIVATGTQAGAINIPAAGNAVPYCPMPNLMGVGDGWDVPPGGDGTDGEGLIGTLVGIMAGIAPLAYGKWGVDTALYKWESATAGIFGESRGGMAYGFLPLASTPTNWTLGEHLTRTGGPSGAGGFDAVVQGVDQSHTGIWLSNINGSLAASDTIRGATSLVTATCNDNVYGFMKGAKWWNMIFGGPGIASPDHANFLAAFGAVTPELLMAFGWEGDLPLPTKSFVFGYTSDSQTLPVNAFTHTLATAQLWAQWIDDVRTQLAAPNLIIDWFVHDLRSQQALFPVAGLQLRYATQQLMTMRTGVKQVIADGYALASASAAAPAPPFNPATLSYYFLFFQPLDYPTKLAPQCWDAYLQASITVPSQLATAAPLLVVISQSQQNLVTHTWLAAEKDNVISRLPIAVLPGDWPSDYSRIDNRDWSWNWSTHAWEPANANNNLGGLQQVVGGNSGSELSWMPRVRQRVGGSFLFKASYSGASSDFRERGIPATFDVTPFTPVVATVLGTMVRSTNSSGQPIGIFTADGGSPFAGFTAGEWAVVTGGSATIGTVGGGNNSVYLQPFRIDPISTPGASIVLLEPTGTGGTFKNGAHETLTITQGPIQLKPIIEAEWKLALAALISLVGRVPHPFAFMVDQAESNINHASDYAAKMGAVIAWMDATFAPSLRGDLLTPLALALLHDKSPVGNPTLRATMKAQQQQVVINRGRAATVTTGDLPIEPGTQYPPNILGPDPNSTYGIHRTPRGVIIQGERTDDALNAMLPTRDLTAV